MTSKCNVIKQKLNDLKDQSLEIQSDPDDYIHKNSVLSPISRFGCFVDGFSPAPLTFALVSTGEQHVIH